MKIKRFFASDIREAIRQVRDEQGPEAVILSNTSVEGGVEIVAAVDYDENLVQDLVPHLAAGKDPGPKADKPDAQTAANEKTVPVRTKFAHNSAPDATTSGAGDTERSVWSQEPTLIAMRRQIDDLRNLLEHQLSGLAWGSAARSNPTRTRLLHIMLETGFSPRLCMEIAEQIPTGCEFASARRRALALLAHRVKVWDEDIVERGGAIALVGPTGVGKTTTIAKLAARFSLRHGVENVVLITSDNYRVGAYEQLRTYACLLDIPLHVARDSLQLREILDRVDPRSLVLIDTQGISQRAKSIGHQLKFLSNVSDRLSTFLVMSAAAEPAVLNEIAHVFGAVDLSGCILTKLDEAASLGGALSVLIQRQLPVAFVSSGQRVPEDLEIARGYRLITRSVVVRQYHRRYLANHELNNEKQQSDDLTRHVAMATAFRRAYSGA